MMRPGEGSFRSPSNEHSHASLRSKLYLCSYPGLEQYAYGLYLPVRGVIRMRRVVVEHQVGAVVICRRRLKCIIFKIVHEPLSHISMFEFGSQISKL